MQSYISTIASHASQQYNDILICRFCFLIIKMEAKLTEVAHDMTRTIGVPSFSEYENPQIADGKLLGGVGGED